MTVQYTVKAQVIDIAIDVPTSKDVFLIDTNVWFWVASTRASKSTNPPKIRQVQSYAGYINKALQSSALVYVSSASLLELAHTIEKTELDIYNASKKSNLTPKEYRHNYPVERAGVLAELQAVWGQVKSMGKPLDTVLDSSTETAMFSRFQNEQIDGYDLAILETMLKNKILNVITHDADYITVSGIQVFTANHKSILAARNQSKLIKR